MTETKQPETNILHIGIDVGSTTVKLAVLNDANEILWAVYRRHHADVRATVLEVLKEAAAQYPTQDFTVAITGFWRIAAFPVARHRVRAGGHRFEDGGRDVHPSN